MHFKINLLKDRVFSPEKRKTIFSGFLFYLFACGLLGIILAYSIVQRFMSVNNLRDRIVLLEAKSREYHPKQDDVAQYSAKMRTRAASHLKKLKSIDDILSKSVNASILLKRISESLPKGVYIDTFSLDSAKNVLDFNIACPAGGQEEEAKISNLMALWKKDNVLMSMIERITSSISKRQSTGRSSVVISQFSCQLAQKE